MQTSIIKEKMYMVISSTFIEVAMEAFSLNRPNFKSQASIPVEHTCKGSDFSPELVWKDVPQSTTSFALTIVDPDAPSGNFIHWIIYNIPATARYLPVNLTKGPIIDNGMIQGVKPPLD